MYAVGVAAGVCAASASCAFLVSFFLGLGLSVVEIFVGMVGVLFIWNWGVLNSSEVRSVVAGAVVLDWRRFSRSMSLLVVASSLGGTYVHMPLDVMMKPP